MKAIKQYIPYEFCGVCPDHVIAACLDVYLSCIGVSILVGI